MIYIFISLILLSIIFVLALKGSQMKKFSTSYMIGIIVCIAGFLYCLWFIMLMFLPGFDQLVK